MSAKKGKENLSFCAKVDRQCRSFANFAYNKQSGEVMGRSGQSWAKIGLFYLAYYGFLAAFFMCCMAVMLTMINEPGKGAPKNIQFLVGDSAPGLTTVPSSKDVKQASKIPNGYADKIENYLKGFSNKGYKGPSCSTSASSSKELCKFNMTELGDCGSRDKLHGYGGENHTCVFVKINKVYGWKPTSNIRLSCSSSGAPVTIHPSTGYYADGFPFEGQSFYQSPPVAVRVPRKGKVTLKCELKGPGIKTSDVFVTSRAYGKIQFDISP